MLAENHVQHDSDAFHELIEEVFVNWLNVWNDASSMTAMISFSNRTGSTMMFERRRFAQPGRNLDVVAGHVRELDALLFQRALADQAFAQMETVRYALALFVSVRIHQLEYWLAAFLLVDVEHAMMRRNQRRSARS
jgi:hypothetical protein